MGFHIGDRVAFIRDLLGISGLKFGAASIDILVIAIGPAANFFILSVVHYRIPMTCSKPFYFARCALSDPNVSN